MQCVHVHVHVGFEVGGFPRVYKVVFVVCGGCIPESTITGFTLDRFVMGSEVLSRQPMKGRDTRSGSQ